MALWSKKDEVCESVTRPWHLLASQANSGSQEGTLEGTLVLKGLNSEDLSHALQKVASASFVAES